MCVKLSWAGFYWKASDMLMGFCSLRLLKKMDRDSSRLRRLMAAASTCQVKMDRRGKTQQPGSPSMSLPPSFQPWDRTTKRQHHTNTVCLTRSIIMSVARHGCQSDRGLSWGWNVFCLLGRKVCWRWGREEHGACWGLAADFISLSEMIFPSVLRMEEPRELGKGGSYPDATTRHWEMRTAVHEKQTCSSQGAPWLLAQKLLTFPVTLCELIHVNGPDPLARKLTEKVLPLITVTT